MAVGFGSDDPLRVREACSALPLPSESRHHQGGFNFNLFAIIQLQHCSCNFDSDLVHRWSCTPPRRWSYRWRRKVSVWRWGSMSSSSVRPSPGWSGTPSPWPRPQKKTTSAPTSESSGTGLRRCMKPVGEIKPNSWRPGSCPSMIPGKQGGLENGTLREID